ncbi:MAG TPA: 4a-hydroxytetrahydrobiopterin dehydratase [Steroidobacteraceae bacterium]|nr:4a-hydroxytetrahydrobiopterin dehydratase [Steroidobacteraceae bacterium]
MSNLTEKHCKPCEGGVAPLSQDEATRFMAQLQPGWQLIEDGKAIKREWTFKNFYRTMSFVNAIAHIANTEDHHPDLEVGYGYCRVRYNTHAIGGLSENDFICAAKVDALLAQ